MIGASNTNQAGARLDRRNTMYTELILTILIAALLYGLINSTDKVLALRKHHNEDNRNLIDYRSRM